MKRFLSTICVLALGAVGCSGASSNLVAPGAQYPISLSDGVRDEKGEIIPDDDLEVVGAFKSDYSSWGMWWNIISFTGDADISKEVNDQVAAAKGEAIVNLAVRSGNTAWNAFTIIGFLPDATTVKVRGHIVRRRAKTTAKTPETAVAEAPVAPAASATPPVTPVVPATTDAPAVQPEPGAVVPPVPVPAPEAAVAAPESKPEKATAPSK